MDERTLHPRTENFPAEELWERLDPAPRAGIPWECFRLNHLNDWLHGLLEKTPVTAELFTAGHSYEGLALPAFKFGTGPRRVLVWARQHGNEPDCTAGLCMAMEELLLRSTEPIAQRIHSELSFLVLPMVNPDGVARFSRRNAQQIDINRDAIAEATPEGSTLKRLRDEFEPELCFNLHDMNPRKSAERQHLVSLAFQAGPFTKEDIDNPVRLRAKKFCAIMAEQARAHTATNVARYTADYMHRAFGDSMMRWGVSSILIEAGGWYEEEGGDDFVRRLFALCLLRGLHAAAGREDDSVDAELYDTLPFDSFTLFSDVFLEGGQVATGHGGPAFSADVAFNRNPEPSPKAPALVYTSQISNIGDLEDELAKRRIDTSGMVVLPGFAAMSAGSPRGPLHTDQDFATACIAAGIATLAHGAGPFAAPEEAASYLKRPQPAQGPRILPFERVADIATIISRHGFSPLDGLTVEGLSIRARDLLKLDAHFHPAAAVTLPEGQEDAAVRADLFFRGSPGRATNSLHLHLSPLQSRERLQQVDAAELERFMHEMLFPGSPVSFSTDALDTMPKWLPPGTLSGGLSRGRLPTPQYLGHILRRAGAESPEDVLAVLRRLPGARTVGLLPPLAGLIEFEGPADLAVFPEAVLSGGQTAWQASPKITVINGEIVKDKR